MNTVNWVVAGIGDIARKRVIPAIQSETRSRLYGFVTRTPAKAAAYAGAKTWPSVEDAVADSAVDAIYIALPVALHASAAITALRAGKHVLCEKPMAMNFAEAERMVAEGQSSGRLFGVSYYRRLYPKLLRAKQLIAEGAIGRPLLAEANCHSWLEIAGREWLVDPALSGGGPLYDIASHRIDAMNFLFGKPERACGLLSNAVHRIAVEDSATVLMQFTGGVHAVVDVAGTRAYRAINFASSAKTAGSTSILSTAPSFACARSYLRPTAQNSCRLTPIFIFPSWKTSLTPCWPTTPRAWPARPSRPRGSTGPLSRWFRRKPVHPDRPSPIFLDSSETKFI